MRVRWACHAHLAMGHRGVGSVRVMWACYAHLSVGYRGCGECAGEVGVSRPLCWGVPGVWRLCG